MYRLPTAPKPQSDDIANSPRYPRLSNEPSTTRTRNAAGQSCTASLRSNHEASCTPDVNSHQLLRRMTPTCRPDPTAPQPHGTIRTTVPHMPESQTSTMNHSNDQKPARKTNDAQSMSNENLQNEHSQSSAGIGAKDVLVNTCRSFDCIAPLYNGFGIVHSQQIIQWIDPLDATGGVWVRAACSNVAPSVWAGGFKDSARIIGTTSVIVERNHLERSANPKSERTLGVSGASSVRRVLRRGRKRGD